MCGDIDIVLNFSYSTDVHQAIEKYDSRCYCEDCEKIKKLIPWSEHFSEESVEDVKEHIEIIKSGWAMMAIKVSYYFSTGRVMKIVYKSGFI